MPIHLRLFTRKTKDIGTGNVLRAWCCATPSYKESTFNIYSQKACIGCYFFASCSLRRLVYFAHKSGCTSLFFNASCLRGQALLVFELKFGIFVDGVFFFVSRALSSYSVSPVIRREILVYSLFGPRVATVSGDDNIIL